MSMIRTANPNYNVEELVHTLTITNASMIFSHPDSVDTALAAARQVKISSDNIILIDRRARPSPIPFPTVQ